MYYNTKKIDGKYEKTRKQEFKIIEQYHYCRGIGTII